MGLLKWIRETNVSNNSTNSNHKRRQSEPIQVITNNRYYKYDKNHKKLIRDDDYIDALLKFNEWRSTNGNKIYENNYSYLKKSLNKTVKHSSKLQKHHNDSLIYETPHKNSFKTYLNNKFHKIERFSLPSLRSNERHKTNNYKEFENNKSALQFDEAAEIYNDIDKNSPIEIINTASNDSPPIKFYRKSINPFLNCKSPGKPKMKSLYNDTKRNSDEHYNDDIIEYEDVETTLCNNLHKNNNAKQKHMYQTIINKHGDPVEYALPILCNKQLKQSKSGDLHTENVYCASKFNDALVLIDEQSEPRRPTIVTDLDKSDGDLYQKLHGESPYSPNSVQFFEHPDNKIDDGNFSKNLDYIIKYKPHDIQIFPYGAIHTTGSELEFGKVYNTKIMRLNYGKTKHYFKENGSKRNAKLLSYFRHPNISLLMGIIYQESNQINSLYMESFSCNLHDLIHKKDKCLEIKEIIDFSQQIISATTYVHENNIIHSNICSYNILISETKKLVKLTSFELATTNLPPEDLNVDDINDENQKSYTYLPYYVNYRKQFSLHIYQAPELLSTTQDFVYPSNQSDVYGICLTIWEMLNQSIPFALFSYNELSKIFDSQTARLPIFEEQRNNLFKPILENGLIINLNERIKNTKILNEFYNEIKIQYLKTKDFEITRVYDTLQNQPRTSTLKRNYKRQCEPNYMNGSINNINVESENCEWQQICENDSQIAKKLPIAKNSKLLKEAWLCENQIADIKIIKRTPNSIGRKIYNLNIRITPKNENSPFPQANCNNQLVLSSNMSHNEANVSEPLKILQKHTVDFNMSCDESPINDKIISPEDANEGENQSSKNVSQHINFWNSINNSTENNEFENLPKIKNQPEKIDSDRKCVLNEIENRNKILNKYYPGMPELLSETFHKNSSNKSFEDSHWKKERKLCEAKLEPNKIDSEKQISVKDAINKFEIISNSPGNKSTSYKKFDNTLKYNIDSKKSDSEFESSLTVVLKSPRNDLIDKTETTENENDKKTSLDISELNLLPIAASNRHSICNPELFKKLTFNTFDNAERLSFIPHSKLKKRVSFTAMQNLKCWNCGIKIFNINNDFNRASSRISDYQESKSIEDLYIDDDFIQNIELGANMELHSEIFDAYL